MNAIEILSLTKKYKDTTAVDRLSFRVEKGELFSLLGINGAGKTTAVKMLCGLCVPTAGDARLLGKSVVKETEAVKRLIAVSPQETAVAKNLSVWENLLFMCGVYGFDREKSAKKCEEMIEKFSLSSVKNKKAGRLSGGFQRRLSIAMALIGEPQILFLDEPTLGLDVIARSEMWDAIRGLKGEITTVLTTHYMEEAETLSDRIGIMKEGQLIALGTVEEIKKTAGKDRFEDAFVCLVKGAGKCE